MTLMDSTPSDLRTLMGSQTLDTSTPLDSMNEETQKKIVAWVSEKYSNMKSARSRQEMVWYVNMAFYAGNQYVELVPRLSRLITPKAPPYRVRHISNRIRPIIRNEISRLTSQKPSASVIPASSEDEDLFAAYAAEQVWESVSNRAHLSRVHRSATWWECITGNSFIKVWWDPQRTDYESNPEGVQGDICFGHVTPFHLYVPDLREEDIQQQPYVLNLYTKPLEWVKKFYGPLLEGKNVTPDVVSASEILNDAYLNLDNTAGNKEPDSVLCQEMWVKNGGCEFLEGDYVIHVVGGHLVSISPMYQHGKYPFIHFGHIPSGKFYRTSVIEDLIPLQREYNRTRSQLIENKNKMASLQMRAAMNSIDANKVTNAPGQIVFYRPGLPPPEPLPLQPIPNYVVEELSRNVTDMEDISGQHEVSRGSVPPGVTAATAISYLQEKDDSMLSHTFADVEENMEEIARQTLSLVGQFWDTQHMVKVVGEEGFFDTLMLRGSDLKSNTDIRMEGGSSLPTSKAAKQALIMDMMKMGFIQPNDGLKILEIGGVQKLQERLRRDESQAQRENIRLKSMQPDMVDEFRQQWEMLQQAEMEEFGMLQMQGSGMPPEMGGEQDPMAMQDPAAMQQAPMPQQAMPQQGPVQPDEPFKTLDMEGMPMMQPAILPVNTWDNHAVHIEVHNNFRKSQAFELLPDKIKNQFEMHVQMHVAAAAQAMQEAQMFGMGMAGGMGGEEMPPGEEPPPEQGGPPPQPGGM